MINIFKCWRVLLVLPVALLFLFFPSPAKAADISWTGASGNWELGSNWSGGVPGAGDNVTIDANVTVTINGTTTVNSLTLGNGSGTTTPTLNFAYNAQASGALIIDDGDVTVNSGSIITHSAGTTAVVGTVYINVQTGNFYLNSSGNININTKGYQGGAGTGAGAAGGWHEGGGGAGHGSAGGIGFTGKAGGIAYDSMSNPSMLGSGGGNAGAYAGGAGGGAVTLTAANQLVIAGTITANGGTGASYSDQYGAGGGSGGTINLTANTISGSGNIYANGGDGAGNNNGWSGGGSGGIIVFKYTTSNTFAGNKTANGGAGPYTAAHGGAGLIFTKSTSQSYGELTLLNSTNPYPSTEGVYPVSSPLTLDSLILMSGATANVSSTLTLTGALSINSGAQINSNLGSTTTYGSLVWNSGGIVSDNGGTMALFTTGSDFTIPTGCTYLSNYPRTYGTFTVNGTLSHTVNATTEVSKIQLTVNNDFTVNTGGSINLTGKGFRYDAGTGKGAVGGWHTGAGGGGHGGAGGNGYTGILGGIAYDDSSNPVLLGSGGGSGGTYIGGYGGGAFILTATDQVTLNGNITANGTDGTSYSDQYGAGGGSGGSVNITAASISGSGNIYANGGNGASNNNGWSGGGGGGLISLKYSTSYSLSGSVTSNGGSGPGAATDGVSTTPDIVMTNQAPDSPSSLGSASFVGGGYSSDTTPTLTFTLSDPDDADQVKYRIQIDDSSNFSSPLVDYTSAFAAEGAYSFTVGQAAGTGSYTTGSESQTLADASYYWRVMATDISLASSSYSTANSGSVAFIIDATQPSAPGTPSTSSSSGDRTPTWTWDVSTDSGSGLSATPYTIEWCSNSSFTGCSSNTATSATNSYTHTTSLDNATWYVRVKATDTVGNNSSYSSNGSLLIDASSPAGLSLSYPESEAYLSDTRPSFKWKAATDEGTGISSYTFFVDNGDSGDLTISGIPSYRLLPYETSKYTVSYHNFLDFDDTNNYIELKTRSTSDWGSVDNDGMLKEGQRSWKITAIDAAGNSSEASQRFYVDTSSPSLSISSVNDQSYTESYKSSDKTLSIQGKLTDSLNGDKTENYVTSGPRNIKLSIEKQGALGVYSTVEESTFTPSQTYWSCSGQVVLDNRTQNCNKYFDFILTSIDLTAGTYKVTLTGQDNAGNSTSSSFTYQLGALASLDLSPQEIEELVVEEETPVQEAEPEVTVPVSVPEPRQGPSFITKVATTFKNTYALVFNGLSDIFDRAVSQVKLTPIAFKPIRILAPITRIAQPIKTYTTTAKGNLLAAFEILFNPNPTQISEVKVIEQGEGYVVIGWRTNHHSTSKVNYGNSYDYGLTVQSNEKTQNHSLRISDLKPNTTYYYEVMSQGKSYVFDARHEFKTGEY